MEHSRLDVNGAWKSCGAKLVPDARFADNRMEAWQKYSVPDGEKDNVFDTPATYHIRSTNEMPTTPMLEDATWTPMPWDATMNIEQCRQGAQAIGSAFDQLAQQRIGAPLIPSWMNPLSRTKNLTRSRATGDIYVRGTEPSPVPPTDQQFIEMAGRRPGGIRVIGGAPPPPPSEQLPPPKLIVPADVGRWLPPPNAFPVYVSYPGFGAGLVVRYLTFETTRGFGQAALFFGVKKFTPLGPTPNAPFTLGIYAVPAILCTRVSVAVAQLFPAENIAVIDDYHGNQYSIPFTTLRSTKDPRYEIARRMLLVDMPYLLSDMFATHLLAKPPPDMQPGGAIPSEMTQTPSIMVAPPATEEQMPK